MTARTRATVLGFGAILSWASLALFTVLAAPVPAFQLNALCFSIASGAGLVWVGVTGQAGALLRIPPGAWALGVTGLFGYHALYFIALRLAPAPEASLIAYLWPLLIVLFSGLLPGEKLGPGHVLGALVAFGGVVLLLGGGAGFAAEAWPGYLAAMACALTWSSYSVLSRRFAAVPTAAIAPFCAIAALLSWAAHGLLEASVWPDAPVQWAAVLALGLGPVGLAFFLWDIGVKGGDIQLLGTLAYAAPLMSTVVLIASGLANASLSLVAASVLIAGGAGLAARASRARRSFEG